MPAGASVTRGRVRLAARRSLHLPASWAACSVDCSAATAIRRSVTAWPAAVCSYRPVAGLQAGAFLVEPCEHGLGLLEGERERLVSPAGFPRGQRGGMIFDTLWPFM